MEKAWEMVFGALLSAQDGVQIESSWDRAYEGYLALSASTHHYRMLKKWASVDKIFSKCNRNLSKGKGRSYEQARVSLNGPRKQL